MNRKGFIDEFVIGLVAAGVLILVDTFLFSSFGVLGLIGMGFWVVFGLVYMFWAKGFLGKLFLGILPLVLAASSVYYTVPGFEILNQEGLFSIRNALIILVALYAVVFARKIVEEDEMSRRNSGVTA